MIDKLGLVDKERMDVAEEVARVIYLYADLNACDTHIRKSVVAGVDKQTDRAGLAVSYDVDGVYITVGRAVVNAVLDVKTDKCALDRNVSYGSLSAAVDRKTVCNVISVDDTSLKEVVASGGVYIVSRMYRAKTYHSLVAVPIRRRSEDSVV